MKDKCEKVPRYKCNKTAGLGCLGCMKYNFYAAGMNAGRMEYKQYKVALDIIKSKKVDYTNIMKTNNSNEYNKLINCLHNWNYDIARAFYLSPSEYNTVKGVLV